MATVRGKTPKCQACKEWVDKSLNDFTKDSKGYYHNSCYNVVAEQGQHYKELIAYICDSFNMQKPTMLIVSQIKHLKEKKGMKYKGMEMTIRYLLEVKGFEFSEIHTSGIQMVEWYYEQTKQHYMDLDKAEKSFKGIEINNKPQRIMLKRDTRKNESKLINIEEI